jgi:tocopherol O-methyltransferase
MGLPAVVDNSSALAMHYGFWDKETSNHAEALINMNRALATRAEVRPGDHVLDAGCGIGGSAIWLARDFGVRVVGITLVPSEVEHGWVKRVTTRYSSFRSCSGTERL